MGIAPGELSADQYGVEVIVPPEEGFLGVGGVDAEVEVSLLMSELELREVTGSVGADAAERGERGEGETAAQPEPGSERLREFLDVVLEHLGVDASVSIVEAADGIRAEISGDDLGIVIGRGGQTVDAMEYLANIALYPVPETRKRVVIDAEGYKERRREKVEKIALDKAREAKKKKRVVKLAPMNAAERKIVHLTLRDRHDVVTESEGKDPRRTVAISPVDQERGSEAPGEGDPRSH